MRTPCWTIVGQGLAGTCLAWELWKRGVEFKLLDRERGGSSRVAAGLVNPVTGKNFEPSRHVAEFLPQALEFYAWVETQIDQPIWHPLPVLRLAGLEKEWDKMKSKSLLPEVAAWISAGPMEMDGWLGAIELTGGGRLDTRAFLDGSREHFIRHGIYQTGEAVTGDTNTIWCDGAAGLMGGSYGPHRCAKGEILTVRAPEWDGTRIRIGAGGWLVPLGGGLFKGGSTYEWEHLDETPTTAGRDRVSSVLEKLGGKDYEIVAHEAGVRPILRRSEPLIGPMDRGGWMFNGLGSKGSLYAPGMAVKLRDWLLDHREPEAGFQFQNFRGNGG